MMALAVKQNPLDRIVELINAIQDPIVIEWICNNQVVTSFETLRADKKKTMKSCLQQMRS